MELFQITYRWKKWRKLLSNVPSDGAILDRFIHRHEQAIDLGLVLGLRTGECFGGVVKGAIDALATEE